MIKKIYFENFKNFSKSEIRIENITTLIGTNSAGKSNMIEGMMVLSEIMTGRDLSAVLDGTKNSAPMIRGGAFSTKPGEKQADGIAVVCNNGQKGRNPDITCIRYSSVISQIATKLS